MKYSDNERGYTMIEMILYIGVLIVLGGVLAGYAHKAIARYKTGRAVQQVVELKKAIVHFTAADEDYANVSIEKMDEHHSLPLDMRTGDKLHAVHALGGEIELGPVADEPLNDDSNNKFYMFFIKFNHLPQESCIEILSQGQFYGDGSELDTLIVNGTQSWQFGENSFYNINNYAGAITTKNDFALICPQGQANADGTCEGGLHQSTRLTVGDAIHACTKEKDNFIIWVFS